MCFECARISKDAGQRTNSGGRKLVNNRREGQNPVSAVLGWRFSRFYRLLSDLIPGTTKIGGPVNPAGLIGAGSRGTPVCLPV